MFLEWDSGEKGMDVNEAITLPGYRHKVKTVSNSHLTFIEKHDHPSGERVEVEQLRCSLFQPAVQAVSSQASGR